MRSYDVPHEPSVQNHAAPRTTVAPGEQRLLRKYMPELDVLRGIAILAVICYHGLAWQGAIGRTHGVGRLFAQLTSGGWMGVNLFFVLSGFLITGILVDSRANPHYYQRFYLRRALRILPIYMVTVGILAWFHVTSVRGVVYCMLFVTNYVFAMKAVGFSAFWSLSVEEQFYLAWPMVVRRVSNRTLRWIAIVVCLIEPTMRWLAVTGRIPLTELRGNTFLIADNLAYGALAALFVRSRRGTVKGGWRMGWGLILFAVAFEAAGYRFGITHMATELGGVFETTPWNILFTGLLLLMLSLRRVRFDTAWTAPLRFLGYVSYGLYLYHLLLYQTLDFRMNLMPWAVTRYLVASVYPRFFFDASVAILVSWISRRFLEDWFLRIKVEPRDKPRKLLEQVP